MPQWRSRNGVWEPMNDAARDEHARKQVQDAETQTAEEIALSTPPAETVTQTVPTMAQETHQTAPPEDGPVTRTDQPVKRGRPAGRRAVAA